MSDAKNKFGVAAAGESNVLTSKDDILKNNDFYCEKCYEMVNYFIDECQTMAPKVSTLKKNYSLAKKDKEHYQNSLDTLQFDYEEMKAQKEDFEERYSILIKSLSKAKITPKNLAQPEATECIEKQEERTQTTTEPVFVNELKRKLTEKLENLESKSVDTEEISGQLEKYQSVEVVNTITLDLNYLTKQFFSETKINSQKILEYFGRKILEAKASDYKRHLEIKYEPTSKKKCTDNDIVLRSEINELQMQLKEAKAKIVMLEKQNKTQGNAAELGK